MGCDEPVEPNNDIDPGAIVDPPVMDPDPLVIAVPDPLAIDPADPLVIVPSLWSCVVVLLELIEKESNPLV